MIISHLKFNFSLHSSAFTPVNSTAIKGTRCNFATGTNLYRMNSLFITLHHSSRTRITSCLLKILWQKKAPES